MMHLGVYCMILILLGFALLFLSESLTPAEIAAMLLTISIHVPAFLTVKTQRAVFGSSTLGPYPEAPVPFLVLANWILIGGLTGNINTYLLTGLAVAIGLGICYAAVRIVAFATTKAVALVSHLPAFDKSTLVMIGNRTIYTLRVGICAVSLVTSSAVLINERGPGLTWMLALLAAFGAIAIAIATWKGTKEFCDRLRATAAAQIANSLTQNAVTTLLYYSQTKPSSIAPMELIERLSSEGVELAVVAREGAARGVLAKSQAHSVWFAPTIATLDAFALQGIKAVFYVNDAMKNGHFIRYNQYHHILVASDALAKAMILPHNIAMYDAVVAPNAKVAALWRASPPSSLRTRIFTVSSIEDKVYLPAYATVPVCPRIAVYVGPDDATGSTPPHLATTIPALIDAALDCDNLHLDLVFPKTGDGLSHALQSREASRADMGGLRQLTGSAVMAANIADIIAVTSATDLSVLRATNKPLIWIGDGPAPSGLYAFNAEHMNQTLSAISNKTPSKPNKIADTNISQTHFNDYPALLAYLDFIRREGIK